MVRRPAHRGVTLLELVIAMALLVGFLAITHKALGKVLLYPGQSLRRFSDRAEAMTVERFLVTSMKVAQDDHVWVQREDSGTAILMGLAHEFRRPDESPVSEYALFSHERGTAMMFRWFLTPKAVEEATGGLGLSREIDERGWARLLELPRRSLMASHVVDLTFELGEPGAPARLSIVVNSSVRRADGEFSSPSYQIERRLSKVGDATR